MAKIGFCLEFQKGNAKIPFIHILLQAISRRKVEQNPDSATKQGEAFSEKKDFGSLWAIFEVFRAGVEYATAPRSSTYCVVLEALGLNGQF